MTKHVTVPIDEAQVSDEDRALVRDFLEEGLCCLGEKKDACEFDHTMLEYIATRSRLNGAAAAAGLLLMGLELQKRTQP